MPEANFVTASPPARVMRSTRASIIGMAAFPIPKPNIRPSRVGRYFCTALNGSTASSAAAKMRKRRTSCKLCVLKRLISISVIISETPGGGMMSRPKVFVTRAIPEKGIEILRNFCDVEVWQYEMPPSRVELLQHVRGVDGLLSLLTDKIDSEVMDEAGPGLRVISNLAVGFDNIDIPAATDRKSTRLN